MSLQFNLDKSNGAGFDGLRISRSKLPRGLKQVRVDGEIKEIRISSSNKMYTDNLAQIRGLKTFLSFVPKGTKSISGHITPTGRLVLDTKVKSTVNQAKLDAVQTPISDKPPFDIRDKRRGVKKLKNTSKYIRRAVAETEVTQTHKKDQNIMVRIFGGQSVLEEGFVDHRIRRIYREHKPDLTAGDVDSALGKLVRIREEKNPREFGLITRRKLSPRVTKYFTAIGAFVELLTSKNKVIRVAEAA